MNISLRDVDDVVDFKIFELLNQNIILYLDIEMEHALHRTNLRSIFTLYITLVHRVCLSYWPTQFIECLLVLCALSVHKRHICWHQ